MSSILFWNVVNHAIISYYLLELFSASGDIGWATHVNQWTLVQVWSCIEAVQEIHLPWRCIEKEAEALPASLLKTHSYTPFKSMVASVTSTWEAFLLKPDTVRIRMMSNALSSIVMLSLVHIIAGFGIPVATHSIKKSPPMWGFGVESVAIILGEAMHNDQ